VKLSMRIPNSKPLTQFVDALVRLENAGLDMAWVAEAYGLDAPTQLGFLAARTSSIELGPGIVNVFTRTPTLIAQTATTLDTISGGRAALGLGVSGPQVVEGFHGMPFARPLERTREVIEICRKVWRGDVLRHAGPVFEMPVGMRAGTPTTKALRLRAHETLRQIPIYVASLGPKNVEMTAAIADGWLTALFAPEFADRVWGDALAEGQARRDPRLRPLEIVAGGTVLIGDDVEHLRDKLRPSLAMLIGGFGTRSHNFYNLVARAYGFETEAELVQELYLDGRSDAAARAVPAELIERTSLIGSERYVRERLDAYRRAGVTVLDVTPMGRDPIRTIEQLKEWW
jgi:F420-dependent oxidoreductase-like protein